MAAAVEAAPILREWEDNVSLPSVVSLSKLLISRRVRYLRLWYVNRGPFDVGWLCMSRSNAFIGHKVDWLAAKVMLTPCRKGSVFDALMRREAWLLSMCVISEYSRVVEGSKEVFRAEVYSETLRKPKNAVRRAAHHMILSS